MSCRASTLFNSTATRKNMVSIRVNDGPELSELEVFVGQRDERKIHVQ
jgi:hypothetical protein